MYYKNLFRIFCKGGRSTFDNDLQYHPAEHLRPDYITVFGFY